MNAPFAASCVWHSFLKTILCIFKCEWPITLLDQSYYRINSDTSHIMRGQSACEMMTFNVAQLHEHSWTFSESVIVSICATHPRDHFITHFVVFTDPSVLKRNVKISGFFFFTLFDVSYDELWLLKVENYSLAKSLVVTLHCLSLPLMYDNFVFSKNSKKKLLCMLMVYRNWDGPKAKDLVMMMSQCPVFRVSEVLNKLPWSF